MQSHEDRVAVITGAGRGIGRAVAVELAERGAKVVLVDLDDPTEAAASIGDSALALTADVTSDADWGRVARTVDERFGRADIVVNNAGIYPFATIDDLDYALWRKTLAINLDSHFYSAKHFVPLMRKNNWGRFVNVSTDAIALVVKGFSHYMASKMGEIGFVRGLANDVAEDGITVNAVLPTIVNTPGASGISDEFKASVVEQQAIKRLAEPEDMVGPIVFLASDDAAFVTGQAIDVGGGLYKIS